MNPPGLTGKVLWLDRIFPVGLIGSDSNRKRLPGVNFNVEYLSGRVDYDESGQGVSEMVLPRVYRVYNGYGGRTDVTYGHVAPCPTSGSAAGNDEYWDWYDSKVGDWDVNTDECAPVWYKPEGAPAGWGQFHKYLALKVVDHDRVGGSPDVVTEYEYLGEAAWALGYGFIDADGSSESWNEWRGYPTVRVHTGTGADPDGYSMVETTFFRGLYHDYYDDWSTRKMVEITNYDGGSYSDLPERAGKPLQKRRYETTSYHPDPAQRSFSEVSSSRYSYEWMNTGDGPGWRNPRMAPLSYQRDRVRLEDGSWRESSRNPGGFNTYGLPTVVKDNGEIGVGDNTCTSISYASYDNGPHYTINFPETTQTWDTGTCGNGQLIARTVNLYDGNGTADIGSQNPYDGDLTEQRTYTSASDYVATRATYDDYGRKTSTTDPVGQTTSIDYQPDANWPVDGIVTTNPAGHTTTQQVSASHGGVWRVVDANGRRTDVDYDQLGRPVSVFLPGDPESAGIASLTFDYDYTYNGTTGQPDAATRVATHTLQSETGGGEYVSSYVFDDGFGRARETHTASPTGGRIVAATYYNPRGEAAEASAAFHNTGTPGDGLANPAATSLPSWTRTEYDTLGRPTAEITMAEDAELWRTTTSYHGDHTTITPPAGAPAVTLWSDVRGNTTLRQEHLPGGGTVDTSYSYDLANQLTQVTDDAGNQWTYTYDLAGRKTAADDPDAGATSYSHDEAGRVTSTTDARGQTITTDYDPLGRPTARWDGASGTGTKLADWVYDTLQAGQPTSATRWHNGNPYTTSIHGYTDRYQPTGRTVTIPAAEGALAGSYSFDYTYTDAGQTETVTLPAAGGMSAETLTTSYTSLGRADRLTSDHAGGTTYVDATSYDKTGDLIQQLLGQTGGGGQVARDLAWDEATGRLDGVTTTAGVDTATPTTVQDDQYAYDPAGNVTTITDATSGQAQCFVYDTLRRLTEAWTTASATCGDGPSQPVVDGPDPYWSSWSFDAIGNRLTQTEHPTAADGTETTTTYSYPDPGQPQPHTVTEKSVTDSQGTVVDGYDYDEVGNTTSRPSSNGQQTLTWGPEGHLDTVTDPSGTSSYIYDVDGNRLISHQADGSATLYLPEGMELHANPSGMVSCTRYYRDIAVRTDDGLNWLAADHHNTATHTIHADTLNVVTRRSGPYGNPRGPITGGTWPDDKTFLGATTDPTGLTHLGAREYDPTLGRFISLDPIMNLTDPQQIHGYTYANNNPTTWDDPTGLLVPSIDRSMGGGGAEDPEPHPQYAPISGWTPAYSSPSNDNGGGRVSRAVNQDTGDSLTTDPDTGQVNINGVLLPGYFTPDPYLLAQHVSDQLDIATGGRSHGDAQRLAFKTLEAILFACAEHAAALQCGYTGDLHTAYALKATEYSGGVISSEAAQFIDAFITAGGSIGGGGRRGAGGRTTRYCSFSGDTHVLMANGHTKPINQIQPGDQVATTDPETGQQTAQTVTTIWIHDDTVAELKLDNGGTITTTTDHPYWNHTDQQWQPADTLNPGDQLLTPNNTTVAVTGLHPDTAHTTTTYNLTIAGIHTYHVLAGEAPVLVHNCGGKIPGHPTICKCDTVKPTSGTLNWQDGSASPGQGWEWRGPGAPGTPNRGAWYNRSTKETLHPDLGHAVPVGPHYDYRAPDGAFYRMFPDGSIVPK